MKQEFDLAIVCALGLERKALLKLLRNRRRYSDVAVSYMTGSCGKSEEIRTCLFQCGVGFASVEKNLIFFLDRVHPKSLLIAGLCGSLSSQLQMGELLSPCKVLSTEKEKPLRCETFPGFEYQGSTEPVLLSSKSPVTTVALKHDSNERTGAVAVDMESYAIAELALQQGIKTTIVRAVSDDSQTELDLRLFHLLKASGDPDYRKVLAGLWRSPGLLPKLFQMRHDAGIAMQNLVDYLKSNDLAQLMY